MLNETELASSFLLERDIQGTKRIESKNGKT